MKEKFLFSGLFALLGLVALGIFNFTFAALSGARADDVSFIEAAFLLLVVGGVMLVSGLAFPALMAVAGSSLLQGLWEVLIFILGKLANLTEVIIQETVREWCEEGN